MSIQTLREHRSALAKNLHEIVDANPGDKWNASHQATYDESMSKIENIDSEIKRNVEMLEKFNVENVNEQVTRFARDSKSDTSILAKWLRGGDTAISAAEWQGIRNVTSTTTGSEGGFTVQSDVAKTLVESLKAFGGMREVAEVITTDMGNPLSFPSSDGTAEVGELIAENATATAADPVFGTVGVNAFKFSSKIVAIPFELLQDSQIDIEAFVNARLVTRLGRVTNQMFTTGTGTAQPRGVVVGSSVGVTGAVGTTVSVTFDSLIDLMHSVDPAYRTSNCQFMMNDLSLRNIRKLKDSQARPIFIPGYEGLGGSVGDSLLGYKITVNQDVAVMAANAKSILFGDFKKYLIRDVMQASMFRFTDSAYAKLGQVGFLMWMRSGGNLLDTAAIKHYANSAT